MNYSYWIRGLGGRKTVGAIAILYGHSIGIIYRNYSYWIRNLGGQPLDSHRNTPYEFYIN